MNKLTLPIKIGNKYVRRDGKIVVARSHHKDYTECTVYVGESATVKRRASYHAYIETGKISADTSSEDMVDLVADYVEESLTNKKQECSYHVVPKEFDITLNDGFVVATVESFDNIKVHVTLHTEVVEASSWMQFASAVQEAIDQMKLEK